MRLEEFEEGANNASGITVVNDQDEQFDMDEVVLSNQVAGDVLKNVSIVSALR